MLEELARVLRYPRLQKLHRLADADLDAFVDSVRRASEVVELELVSEVVPHEHSAAFRQRMWRLIHRITPS